MYFNGSEKCFFTYPEKVYAILHTPFQEDITPMAASELSQNILLLLPQFSERQFCRGYQDLLWFHQKVLCKVSRELLPPNGIKTNKKPPKQTKKLPTQNKTTNKTKQQNQNHPKVKSKEVNVRADSSLYLYSCNRSHKYLKMFVCLAIGFSKV